MQSYHPGLASSQTSPSSAHWLLQFISVFIQMVSVLGWIVTIAHKGRLPRFPTVHQATAEISPFPVCRSLEMTQGDIGAFGGYTHSTVPCKRPQWSGRSSAAKGTPLGQSGRLSPVRDGSVEQILNAPLIEVLPWRAVLSWEHLPEGVLCTVWSRGSLEIDRVPEASQSWDQNPRVKYVSQVTLHDSTCMRHLR